MITFHRPPTSKITTLGVRFQHTNFERNTDHLLIQGLLKSLLQSFGNIGGSGWEWENPMVAVGSGDRERWVSLFASFSISISLQIYQHLKHLGQTKYDIIHLQFLKLTDNSIYSNIQSPTTFFFSILVNVKSKAFFTFRVYRSFWII